MARRENKYRRAYFGYDEALDFFDCDPEMTEFLEGELYDEEKDDLVFIVWWNDYERRAGYAIGNSRRESPNLCLCGRGIDNTIDVEDDYEGVKEWLRRVHKEEVEKRERTKSTKQKMLEHGIWELLDGLTFEELEGKYPWILEAKIDDAVIGKRGDQLVWYDGKWYDGTWKGAYTRSGEYMETDPKTFYEEKERKRREKYGK